MSQELLTFKIFKDAGAAQDFAEILKDNHIPYKIEKDALNFDPSYAFNSLNEDYRLKLRQEDFATANDALANYYKAQAENIDRDYYLFGFDDEELQEIIEKSDEWGAFDYQLAQRILKERGKEVPEEKRLGLQQNRLQHLASPTEISQGYVVLGYLVALIFPPIGIFWGWNWRSSQKTLPDGNRNFAYPTNIRQHGNTIFFVGIVMLVLAFTKLFTKVF